MMGQRSTDPYIVHAAIMTTDGVWHFYPHPAPTDTAAEPGCTLPREEGEPLS